MQCKFFVFLIMQSTTHPVDLSSPRVSTLHVVCQYDQQEEHIFSDPYF